MKPPRVKVDVLLLPRSGVVLPFVEGQYRLEMGLPVVIQIFPPSKLLPRVGTWTLCCALSQTWGTKREIVRQADAMVCAIQDAVGCRGCS